MAITTISTLQKSINSRSAIASQDAAVQKAQKEITTGLQEDVYSSVGFRAAQSLDLRNRMERMQIFATQNKLLSSKMSVTSTALGNIRADAQDYLSSVISLGTSNQVDYVLKTSADAAIARISTYLNTTYGGEYLFSGENSSVPSISIPTTGLSTGTLASNASLADIDAALLEIDAYFGFSGTAPAVNYISEAYEGSLVQQRAQTEEYTNIGYGVTGNNESLRLILKGLVMMSNTDVSALADANVQTRWMEEARTAINQGISGLQVEESKLGSAQDEVERAIVHQERLNTIYNNSVLDLEGVDSYEAATRLEALSNQLEASYAVTARLKNLSLLSYL